MAQYATENSGTVTTAAAPTVANPAPLGLCAFALTTFVLSSANAGLFTLAPIVTGLAFFYGGLCQLLAGLQEFKAGNTFGATAFCSYGGFWLAIGITFTPAFGLTSAPGFATGLGYFLLGWTIFTGLMFLGTLRANVALLAVFGLLFLTFLFLTIGALGASSGMTHVGGWLGIITAIVAWYTGIAGVLSSTKSAFTLPVWPIS
jgi:succinate-acetate transporter protein